jgi:predicted AAA+ superfamily ATPase
MYLYRLIEKNIPNILCSGKSILLLGPRQTGKTTLINHLKAQQRINLADPRMRVRYEKDPFVFSNEVEQIAETVKNAVPLVIVDEIQKVPRLMDAIQDLIDRKIAQFILTGSSARKLRRSKDFNLLPGRVIPLRLDPLTQLELTAEYQHLETLLLDGALPEIILEKEVIQRERLLDAYVTTYLEEEIRAEAVVRDLGHFARFLELAAAESGKIVNFNKLSQEIGVMHTTIASYYQILEDCLVTERIEPITQSKTRRKLSRSQKYLFYDMGVRRLAAREGRVLPETYIGHLFEQYIGLELVRLIRAQQKRFAVRYWRDPSGPEVDWVIETDQGFIPIEVKWTDIPRQTDAKYLQLFLEEYPQSTTGYIVCRTPQRMKISENIYALPWNELAEIF